MLGWTTPPVARVYGVTLGGKPMRTLSTWMWLALVITLLGAPRLAGAEDDPLAHAMKLRNESTELWRAKRYTDAAAKLREAAIIYEGLEKPPANELAVTLRALIWNEKLAGEWDVIATDYIRLLRLVKANPDLDSELQNALGALWQAATAQSTHDRGNAIIAPVLQAAEDMDHQAMVGQLLHSSGSLASTHQLNDLAVDYFERAIRVRTEIQDRVGLGWSLNNLANVHVKDRGEPMAALDALDRCHALVHEEGVYTMQSSLGFNMNLALTQLTDDGTTAPPDKALEWIRRIIGRLATSKTGATTSFARIGRTWLAWTAATKKAADIAKVGKQLLDLKPATLPVEVRADLAIRAADAVLTAGRPKTAASWLKAVEVGTGLCADHLRARMSLVTARIAATEKSASKRKKAFLAAATQSFELWRAQTDRLGRKDAYRALLDAATACDAVVELADVQKALNDLESEGVPGGPGGFATASGNRAKVDELALDDVLFTIRQTKDGIEVHDVAAGNNQTAEVEWMPKSIGFNGLSLTLFGGYAVVKRLNYGGSASAEGTTSEIRLHELGDYHAVPGKGALLVQKNGAIRYRTR